MVGRRLLPSLPLVLLVGVLWQQLAALAPTGLEAQRHSLLRLAPTAAAAAVGQMRARWMLRHQLQAQAERMQQQGQPGPAMPPA